MTKSTEKLIELEVAVKDLTDEVKNLAESVKILQEDFIRRSTLTRSAMWLVGILISLASSMRFWFHN